MRLDGLTLAFVCATAFAARAQGATTSLSIIISSPPSTSVTCPLTPPYTAPLAAGSIICTVAIAPAGWSGALTLSGTNASSFALQGTNLVVAASPLAAGTYAVTITATP